MSGGISSSAAFVAVEQLDDARRVCPLHVLVDVDRRDRYNRLLLRRVDQGPSEQERWPAREEGRARKENGEDLGHFGGHFPDFLASFPIPQHGFLSVCALHTEMSPSSHSRNQIVALQQLARKPSDLLVPLPRSPQDLGPDFL